MQYFFFYLYKMLPVYPERYISWTLTDPILIWIHNLNMFKNKADFFYKYDLDKI